MENWAMIDAQLNKYPREFIAEAFWHLDQAGAVLISYQDTDSRPVKDGDPTETPWVTLVPMPVDHKVVLQR